MRAGEDKMKSDVYFSRLDSTDIGARTEALKKLLAAAEPSAVYGKNELVPVKLTVGDSMSVHHLDPELVKWVTGWVKSRKAKPFLFDTSVIYHGQRQNAVDHMNLAQSKGFGHTRVGAPFIIADGVLGLDGREYSTGSPEIKQIRVPSFVGMLDSLLVLSHPTGHVVTQYAGALKNVAMGMVCRPTKQVQHSSLKPSVIAKKCTGCGCCGNICPAGAVSFKGDKAFIDQGLCLGCGECLCACKFGAIFINWEEEPFVLCKRMVHTAKFILSRFKNVFFINFAFDITRDCDCISDKDDVMVAGDIGILASRDIVSVDKATLDLISSHKKAALPGKSGELAMRAFEYAAENGLGSLEYNLIEL